MTTEKARAEVRKEVEKNEAKLRGALEGLDDEAKKEAFRKNPGAFIENLGISLPADAKVYALEGEEAKIQDVGLCFSLCWFIGVSIGF